MTPPPTPQTSALPNWANTRTDTWQAAVKLEQSARREVVGQIKKTMTRRAQRTFVLSMAVVAILAAGWWLAPQVVSQPHAAATVAARQLVSPQSIDWATIPASPETVESRWASLVTGSSGNRSDSDLKIDVSVSTVE